MAWLWCFSGSLGLLSCACGFTLLKLLEPTNEICLVLIAIVIPLKGKETVLEYSAELSGVCLISEVILTMVFNNLFTNFTCVGKNRWEKLFSEMMLINGLQDSFVLFSKSAFSWFQKNRVSNWDWDHGHLIMLHFWYSQVCSLALGVDGCCWYVWCT